MLMMLILCKGQAWLEQWESTESAGLSGVQAEACGRERPRGRARVGARHLGRVVRRGHPAAGRQWRQAELGSGELAQHEQQRRQ